MSQRQIQSLGLLSKSSDDLRKAIYEEVEKNPALQISFDPAASGKDFQTKALRLSRTRISSVRSQALNEASDAFQKVLEAQEDYRESLQDHLLHQLNMMNLDETTLDLCEKLIRNLNEKGHHLRAPVSLLNTEDSRQTQKLLDNCKNIVQQLDPVGCCVNDFQESLLIQAQFRGNASPLTLFILEGHLDFISPPDVQKGAKKIKAYLAEQKKMFAQTQEYEELEVTEDSVQESLDYIRTLNPFPAQDFSVEETHYISPDISIEAVPYDIEEDNEDQGLITTPSGSFRIKYSRASLPQLTIYSDIEKLAKSKNATAEDKKHAAELVKQAKDFTEDLKFREDTVLRMATLLLKKQHKFFKYGSGNLVPLKQIDVAKELEVHESTVSRTAKGKYLICEWGTFDFQYFFSNAAAKSEDSQEADISKDQILFQIKAILEEHKNDTKKLSDQKVSDLLAEKGISVARRTVAKYRSQLNIESSYMRQ